MASTRGVGVERYLPTTSSDTKLITEVDYL